MIRAALVGYGRWGKKIKATLETIPGVKLAAVCATDERELNDVTDCFTTTDVHELVGKKGIEAVFIATPGTTHAKIATLFVEQGIATFIEKPLTTSLKDAYQVQHVAKKSGAIVGVGHIHLYNPAYQKAKELVQASGVIRNIVFEGMNNGPFRADMSALWDWAPHDIAMAIDLFGRKPHTVQAWGKSLLRPGTTLFDTVLISLHFSEEVSVAIIVSWLSPEKRKKMMAVGEQHSVVFDDTAERKVVLYQNMGPRVEKDSVVHQDPIVSYPAYKETPPLQLELEAFVKAVAHRVPPPTSLEQGIDVVAVIAAAEKSILSAGKKVSC